jgi:hypothetical protein
VQTAYTAQSVCAITVGSTETLAVVTTEATCSVLKNKDLYFTLNLRSVFCVPFEVYCKDGWGRYYCTVTGNGRNAACSKQALAQGRLERLLLIMLGVC